MKKIKLEKVKEPEIFSNIAPVTLTDETMRERKAKFLDRMKEEGLDTVIIYADKEHGSNFEYLTGFFPRFEEGLLILESNGKATLILGNENLKMAAFSRLPVDLIHSPLFSLANQPMDNEANLESIFDGLGLAEKKSIGLIAWKMFTTQKSNPSELFDLPYFIVEALTKVIDKNKLSNAAHLMIGDKGARTTNNANEIAHYEYGANLASCSILNAMNQVAVGKKEVELGAILSAEGQYHSVVTIAATGQRFEKANFYPTYKEIKLGDPLSLTVGYKGGLSSRTGFVIENESQLPENQKDYLDKVAKPYFHAVANWLEEIKIGMTGGDFYQIIERAFPKADYHWHLNPGHLVADEEWMSSPIYENSNEILKSGMIFQLDIIPSISGYTGVSAEECLAIADSTLQVAIQEEYPELWHRICTRRAYLKEELNISLTDDVIPLSNTLAYLRPFYLAKDKALKVLED